jgi:tryptophan synthase beta chain
LSRKKIQLDEEEIPKEWYNILPDLPEPLPPLINPQTKEPVRPEDLEAVFAKELIRQEVSSERWIPIPEEVREIYRMWRPTPLYRAYGLEKALNTPARIYYKWEGVSPPGSHKPNTAIAQAYYNLKEGTRRLTTETGAGQWGSALAFACAMFDLKCTVYMVKASYYQKPYRKTMMQVWNAEVIPSPSTRTEAGRKILERDPKCPGSLGISISEAVNDAVTHEDTKYTLGSVVNHVLLHQTVIGLELQKQFQQIDEYPDIMFGCVGGGSSFSGFSYPFLREKMHGEKKELRAVAVEPAACPTLTKGPYRYDHGDSARLIPLVKMYTLGHDFVPEPIHAGGLRYHGDAPILSLLVHKGVMEAKAYLQNEVFQAAVLFTKTEGIIPAPEPSYAIKAVVDEALECKRKGEEKVLAFNLCGHGHFDMSAYDAYFERKLPDYSYPEEKIKQSIKKLEELYPWLK